MINVDLEKNDIVNLLCGFSPNLSQSEQLEKAGFMENTGNGWSVGWKWKRETLNQMDENILFHLYVLLSRKQDKPLAKFEVKLPWSTKKESVENDI